MDDATGSSLTNAAVWRKCSVCKKPIGFRARYYLCSVSTCNGLRTGYVFCSVDCFESHIPGARHKSAGALEKTSPSRAEAQAEAAVESGRTPQRVIARPAGGAPVPHQNQTPREVLVIASRLKDYITARSEFNTSQSVMDFLSDHLRALCDRAIDQARSEGRKTVMDRDFSFLKK